jgi:hypothetical protein
LKCRWEYAKVQGEGKRKYNYVYLKKTTTMKKLLLLLVLFSFINCSKDDNAVNLIVGSWRETQVLLIGSKQMLSYQEFTFYSDGTYSTDRDSTGKWKRNKNPGNPQITYELDGSYELPGYGNSDDDRVIFITDEENGLGYINNYSTYIDAYRDPFEYREFIQDGWDEHSFIKFR